MVTNDCLRIEERRDKGGSLSVERWREDCKGSLRSNEMVFKFSRFY